eukprot:SM000014S00272  [mRNA]  locus=s14:285020:285353:- [translate_table: standard]
MVDATKGLLVECDVPMAQFIVSLDAKLDAAHNFLLARLDDTHLLVQPAAADMLRRRVQDWMAENTYQKPDAPA